MATAIHHRHTSIDFICLIRFIMLCARIAAKVILLLFNSHTARKSFGDPCLPRRKDLYIIAFSAQWVSGVTTITTNECAMLGCGLGLGRAPVSG